MKLAIQCDSMPLLSLVRVLLVAHLVQSILRARGNLGGLVRLGES